MEPISDEVFGGLEFSRYWSGKVELTFLGVAVNAELIVEGNDEHGAILDEQRASFRQLMGVVSKAEDAILEHYQSICDDYRDQFGSDADIRMPRIRDKAELSKLVKLTGVVFPMVIRPGDISVGFLLECSWDPEHGLAVKITNGELEVGTQDILT